MKKEIIKKMLVMSFAFLIFFINKASVNAYDTTPYKSALTCEYRLYTPFWIKDGNTYYQNLHKKSEDFNSDFLQLTVTVDGDKCSSVYQKTLNNDVSESIDSSVDYVCSAILGKIGMPEGEAAGTCPRYIYYKEFETSSPGGAYIYRDGISAIAESSAFTDGMGNKKLDTYYDTAKKIYTSGEKDYSFETVKTLKQSTKPYHMYLYEERKDGGAPNIAKSKEVWKKYFEKFVFSGASSSGDSPGPISTYTQYFYPSAEKASRENLKYIDYSNYKDYFNSFEEWEAYCQQYSSTGKNDFDKDMTEDLWQKRRELLAQYRAFEVQMGFVEYFRNKYNDNKFLADNYRYDRFSKVYQILQGNIDDVEQLEEEEDLNEAYTQDSCNVFCKSYIGDDYNYEKCTQYNLSYKNCKTCYSDPLYNTPGIPSSEKEKILKECLGTDSNGESLYDEIQEEKKRNEETLEELKEKMGKVNLPKFDINYDPNGYKIKCEDIEYIHFIYAVMRVIAPLLVVLFGTIDYTQSVFGGNEEKILQARKKFPKRLMLLILFILVPVIIDFIISIFGGDASLMKCIVLGK